ncbi:MAG: type II toxin-antitoxin system PemK/MazF family toxin [Coriobacteriia bacterium]|nr:type II toxin-antitoxin system PemK/MazF family toxin [Coriobacteriia bacterium]MBW6469341.1 type II toxin-antitoxin system PemK/MazF family toxin [Coriobacteriia bacterium]
MGRPRRGEVWLADLEPVRGQEMNKVRPVVILSSDEISTLRVKLAAPVTAMTSSKAGKVWLVHVRPTTTNGLAKDSCVDAMQVRGVSDERLSRRLGRLSARDLQEVVAAVALVIEYEAEQAE